MIREAVPEFIRKKEAVIFDLFHTLTSVDSVKKGGPMTCEVLGVSKEDWNEQLLEKSRERLIGKERDPLIIIKKMAHAINPEIPLEVIIKATENRIHRFESSLIHIPENAVWVLKRLKEMKKKIGLISNADVTEIAGWRKSPIAALFDSTVFSCDAGYAKPDREIYEIGLNELGVKPENAVFIGDGGSDELWGAKQVGLTTIMFTGIVQEIWPDRIESRMPDADYIIENIEELITTTSSMIQRREG